MALNPQNMYSIEHRVAYLASPWVDELSVQCLSVTYYNMGVSINTLAIFLQYDDEYLHVSLKITI